MADPKAPPALTEGEPSEPPIPTVPAEVWGAMPPEERERAGATSHEIERIGTALANIEKSRQALVASEEQGDLVSNPASRELSKMQHAILDRVREDLKATHAVHVARFDKAMWRAMFEYTQMQLRMAAETAKREREADMDKLAAQRKEDRAIAKVGVALGLAGIIVAILTLIFGK